MLKFQTLIRLFPLVGLGLLGSSSALGLCPHSDTRIGVLQVRERGSGRNNNCIIDVNRPIGRRGRYERFTVSNVGQIHRQQLSQSHHVTAAHTYFAFPLVQDVRWLRLGSHHLVLQAASGQTLTFETATGRLIQHSERPVLNGTGAELRFPGSGHGSIELYDAGPGMSYYNARARSALIYNGSSRRVQNQCYLRYIRFSDGSIDQIYPRSVAERRSRCAD